MRGGAAFVLPFAAFRVSRGGAVREWLIAVTERTVVVIDAMALLIVVVGTVVAFVAAVRAFFAPLPGRERRTLWLNYARWLVAGLTFQLAADIIESSITEDWQAIARLAAVAVIRTFLDYFLERDLSEIRERNRATEEPAPGR
jgi:uncharacterized membrane protein